MKLRYTVRTLMIGLLASVLLMTACTGDGSGNETSAETVADTSVVTEAEEETVAATEAETEAMTEALTEAATDASTEPTTEPEAITSAETEATVETTPAENETEAVTEDPAPIDTLTMSHTGGVYTEAISLEMYAPEGQTIRYTTDGSVPIKQFKEYKEAITVDKGALTIRAACFDESGKITGDVVTNTYVIREAKESTLYTVMISVDKDDLDDMIADYAEKIERPAHVEIVTPDGETIISQDAGLRLFGGSSRALQQKSFKLIARKTGYFGEDAAYVGQGTFRYALFPERVIKGGAKVGQVLDRYDSFILRNGGNDSLLHTACNPEDATLIRDGMANNFAADVTTAVEYSYSQYAVVYINGDYYGLLDMRENLNEDFVKRVWGVDDNDVVVIKSELDTTRACADHDNGGGCRYCGSWFFYETDDSEMAQNTLNEWLKFCEEICGKVNANDDEYNAAFQKLEANVDLVGLKEWYALNLYLCNTDWPHNNIKLWKYTGEPVEGIEITDGKWRFMTRDMDMTMGRYSRPELTSDLDSRAKVDSFWRTLGNYIPAYHDIYSDSGETKLYADALYLQGLFAFCMRNDEFRAEFTAYCRELISEEKQDLLKHHYDTLVAQVSPEMGAYIERWSRVIGSDYAVRNWTRARRSLTDFMKDRPAKFEAYLDLCLSMYK